MAFASSYGIGAAAAVTALAIGACGLEGGTAHDGADGSSSSGGTGSGGSTDDGRAAEAPDSGTMGSSGRSGSGASDGGTLASDAGAMLDGTSQTSDASAADGSVAIEGPETFHGVNWADPRDNYVNGLLQLSGLNSGSDSYATVQMKASQILSEFQTKLGANTIRIPINESTVSSSWWNAYKAVIDTATGKGMKVMVAYWAYQNGKPNDETAFNGMWRTVVSAYANNHLVYFDIHNEPYGFGSAWTDEAARWLTNFPNVPKSRVIVAGTGYDDNVNPIGSDARFEGCLLELHIYGFWHQDWKTQKQWTDSMKSSLGSYTARTVVGEWGDTMNGGTNYNDTTDGDNARSYVTAVSNVAHSAGMGSVYWPGLRNGDGYSMTTLNTAGSTLTLSVTNASGLDRLHWAWHL